MLNFLLKQGTQQTTKPSLQLIDQWLQKASRATSADNMQPWKITGIHLEQNGEISFSLEINQKTIYNPSSVDANFSASYMALGSFAKNLELLAAEDGYILGEIIPQNYEQCTFKLIFKPLYKQNSSLTEWISFRHTNRLPYKRQRLGQNEMALIQSIQQKSKDIEINYFQPSELGVIKKVIAKLEVFRYQNKGYFFDFINKVRFFKENEKTKDGLSDYSLGQNIFAVLTLMVIRKFKSLWLLNFMGAQHISTYLGCTRLIDKSAGLISLQAQSDTPMGWFNLGRKSQEVWLRLNAQGIAVQPMANSLIYYRAHLESKQKLTNAKPQFSPEEVKKVTDIGEKFLTNTILDPRLPLFIMRIGYAKKSPQKLTLRRDNMEMKF